MFFLFFIMTAWLSQSVFIDAGLQFVPWLTAEAVSSKANLE